LIRAKRKAIAMESFVPPTPLDPRLYRYLVEAQPAEHPALVAVRRATAALPNAEMQIAPEQAPFLSLLLRLIGARRTLEVGVFTGYSALATALAIGPEGRITACELDPEYAAIAERGWRDACVRDQIDLRLGPATRTLEDLLQEGNGGSYDFAFLDADKANYDAYYELALKLVRKGGLIAIDNTLWDGKVANPEIRDADTVAIRNLNARIKADARIDACLVSSSDGLTLCRVR
jgi:predicted O-methyltransferase YrrM